MSSLLDNISQQTINIIGLLIPIILSLIPVIRKLFVNRRAVLQWRQSEMDNKFNPQFDDNDQSTLKLITSPYYIPVKGQLTPPHNDAQEYEVIRVDLVKTLIRELTTGKGKLRYLILGGSGMGKSVFSAAFFHTYINLKKYKKSPYPIYVQYLGDERSLGIIEQIIKENRDSIHSSILILDSLDECKGAVDNRESFWENLNKLTHDFKVVIITCRPQFFDNESAEPTETTIWVNTPSGRLSYKKYYISPFSEDDVQHYLQTKYRIESEDYRKAKLVSDQCKDLTIRPMVLGFIDTLKDYDGHSAPNIAELYYRIIDAWLGREYRHLPLEKQVECRITLFHFSKELAFFIFRIWQTKGRSYLTSEEYAQFVSDSGYSSSPYSFKERSLLNRTSEGHIKFSHKCFWEYFIAVLSMERPGIQIDPNNMDVAKRIYNIFYNQYLHNKEFWFIDYYTPSFLKDDEFSEHDEDETFSSLKDWWFVVVRRIPAAFTVYRELLKKNPLQKWDFSSEEVEKLCTYVSWIDEYIYSISCFIKTEDAVSIKMLAEKDVTVKDIFFEKLFLFMLAFFPSNVYLRESLVMPNILDFDERTINATFKSVSPNFVSIGCGLNNPDSIYITITYLFRAGICPDVITVYREGNDLNEHVTFINGLKAIENKPRIIIIVIHYDEEQVVFVLNRLTQGYDSDTILSFLQNQIPNPDKTSERRLVISKS